MSKELPAEFYDRLHGDGVSYAAPFHKSRYYALFMQVVAELRQDRARDILEVGSGSGILAHMIMTMLPEASYRGFDFSATAAKAAGERTGRPDAFAVGDAKSAAAYAGDYDAIVCTEVLEHIEDDFGVIANWRPGTPCICSVPNFPYDGHVRVFRTEAEVQARYGEWIDIRSIRRVAVPVMGEGNFRDYLRRLRWSRDNPRKFLALLGINTFDNLAGWFVFAGRRNDRSA